ncbi:hypothetical protein EJ08DRAFT_701323 [Tothia fuscella]|uniref:Uncharacterized protein n=1 Tax=Tothia fuscella TaxID=1048955 RepID=A0A9P4NJ98_9PEZI|nr:hypothetical protein EJ08DRAFT_701323 [Tothia fuscella]
MEPRCYLLTIPLELRLQIYDYALEELSDVTITVAERERNTFDSADPAGIVKGLPGEYIPVVKNCFDSDLLKIGKPDVIPLTRLNDLDVGVSIDSGYGSFGLDGKSSTEQPCVPHLTSLSLLLTNRQTHEEFALHIRHPTACHSTLHVTYPYGLIVLQELYPTLLRHCAKVNISGFYDASHSPSWGPTGSTTQRRQISTTSSRNQGPPIPTITLQTHDAATGALTRLTQILLSKTPHPTFQSLSMRIFYPDEQRYGILWECDASPTVVVLRNTAEGNFDMKVWRGRCGNGIETVVLPTKGRHVSTAWRKFNGDRKVEGRAWGCFGDGEVWGQLVGGEGSGWS